MRHPGRQHDQAVGLDLEALQRHLDRERPLEDEVELIEGFSLL
jgi:hypothetical protein